MQTETVYYGDRKISIRTSVLEEKATACNMLCCYADELEVGFFPYVEQVNSSTYICVSCRPHRAVAMAYNTGLTTGMTHNLCGLHSCSRKMICNCSANLRLCFMSSPRSGYTSECTFVCSSQLHQPFTKLSACRCTCVAHSYFSSHSGASAVCIMLFFQAMQL